MLMSALGALVKISKFALKSCVIIDKTKIKTYIFKTKFLLKDYLTSVMVSKTQIYNMTY